MQLHDFSWGKHHWHLEVAVSVVSIVLMLIFQGNGVLNLGLIDFRHFTQ
jgi:hypothetical protein